MKSEERHELETNTLAKLLETGSDKAAPYASYIIYGLLAVVAVWAIVRLTSSSMVAKKDAAWDAYTMAVYPFPADTDALRATADKYENQEVGEFAELAWADSQLAQGCREYFIDKKVAMEALDNALKQYEDAAGRLKNPVVRSRAEFGAAKALEAKGEIAAAIAAYNKVTGVYSELADNRAELLEEWKAQDVAGWLATAEGARRATGSAGGGMPSFSPDGLELPSTDPAADTDSSTEDFFKALDQYQKIAPEDPKSNRYENADEPATEGEPAVEGDTTEMPSDDAATSETPSTEAPVTETPATEAPATETPTTDAPATEASETPATDAPATETPAATQPE